MSPEFWIGLFIGIGVFIINEQVRKNAPARHAKYRMRVRLARWLYEGKLRPVSVRRTVRKSAPKRGAVLSVVRRDDAGAGPAAS